MAAILATVAAMVAAEAMAEAAETDRMPSRPGKNRSDFILEAANLGLERLMAIKPPWGDQPRKA